LHPLPATNSSDLNKRPAAPEAADETPDKFTLEQLHSLKLTAKTAHENGPKPPKKGSRIVFFAHQFSGTFFR